MGLWTVAQTITIDEQRFESTFRLNSVGANLISKSMNVGLIGNKDDNVSLALIVSILYLVMIK